MTIGDSPFNYSKSPSQAAALPNSRKLEDLFFKGYFTMKPSAKDVLMYIVGVLPAGKDYVELKAPKVMKSTGIKSNETYYRSLKTLMERGYIARSLKQGTYFINLNKMFI
jgi:hypothetical protein